MFREVVCHDLKLRDVHGGTDYGQMRMALS